MAYPKYATNRNKKGTGQGRGGGGATSQEKRPPSGFTGRLVTTTGSDHVHWCPKPQDGHREWTCPDCGAEFRYSEEKKQWQPAAA